MLKRSLLVSSFLLFSSLTLNAANISEEACSTKGENFIFTAGECIEYKKFNGDSEDKLNIIVHGTWPEGTNTLGRYGPFAESIAFQTDVSTIAVALPGYSNSSTNRFPALSHEGVNNLSANKDYINFLGDLVEAFKEKYEAKTITYIGHSAGCSMGATLTGIRSELVNNILCAGGNYDIHKKTDAKNLISIIDVLDKVDRQTKFVLVYGTADEISKPEITKEFYEIAKQKGLKVKLVEAKNAPHLDLDMSDASVKALIELVEE